MTNFDSEACNELIISEVEAKEIAHQLQISSNISGHRKSAMRKQQPLDVNEEEMDATSVAYLCKTYPQRGENHHQVGLQFGGANENGSAKRVKRKLNIASMDVEGSVSSSNSSYEGNNEICELARDLKNMQFAAERLKPIITFTPVHSADDEDEAEDGSGASPFSDRRSSGSSSPLLEVPICAFRDMSAEMMRPPLN